MKPAFDEVNGAQQVKERLINEAQAYAAKVVPEARGQASRARTTAEGYKQAVVSKAEGDAQRFSLLQAQYKDAPEVTRKRLWLETVQQVLSENRKVIGGDGRQLIYVPMTGDTRPTTSAPPGVTNPEVVMPSLPGAAAEASRDPGRPVGRPTGRPSGREEGSR